MDTDHWLVCPHPNPRAEVRLFLFPYAGGAPSAFHKWHIGFPGTVETWIAHYPGRGSRFNETPVKELAILVEKIFQAIQPQLDKPYIFFGHSLGGMTAFELARRLSQEGLPQPQILFVSACGAPHIPDPNPPVHQSSDPEFIKFLESLNGIPAEILAHSEVMELLLPSVRADFEAAESYRYIFSDHQLSCPIVAFGGVDDPRISRDRLEGWAFHTNAGFKSQYFSGDHFFINAARDSVIASMIAEIASAHAKR